MDQIIKAWSERYGASIFYNFIEKDDYVVCILVICLKDDVETYKGSSKTLSKCKVNVKPKQLAKTLAQAAALNGYLMDIIDHTTEEDNQVLDFGSHDVLEALEEDDEE
jgi:hypothetical protein